MSDVFLPVMLFSVKLSTAAAAKDAKEILKEKTKKKVKGESEGERREYDKRVKLALFRYI